MDAVHCLLLRGGLALSTGANAQAISTPHLSPSTLPSTPRRRRFLCLAAASPPSPLPAASTQTRCSKWVVVMENPTAPAGGGEMSRAEAIDYYVATLAMVLGSEKDAQVSIYHISWERDYCFCCHIDEDCAKELADVPGVLFVRPDTNFGSDHKDYKGDDSLKPSEATQVADVKTKRLFVTGLSFYTSEKTLRAAFEPFGELVEVKIIMDKISKRSKGYAFIEYTTEEAGGAALKTMNGQIINGWMIVVDVAKTRSRDRQSPSSATGRPHQMHRLHYHTR